MGECAAVAPGTGNDAHRAGFLNPLLREAQGVGFLEDAIPLDRLVVTIDAHATAAASSVVADHERRRSTRWKLMAAEIYVTILTGFGLGNLLHYGRELNAMDRVIAVMLMSE